MSDDLWRSIERVREYTPLVHNITNYVAMNNTANALLALGASPVMAHAVEEVEELVGLAGALVINIGTLSGPWITAMQLAARRARALGRPWVLDPVGAGATALRTNVSTTLLAERPTVVRGNASEVLAVAGAAATTKGVDSTADSADALAQARALARTTGGIVAVTGAVDYVTDGTRVRSIANGDPMMARVTGLGCTASALIGAFLAVEPDPLEATTHALATLGVAGELAAAEARGPGSLQLHLLDALYRLDRATLEARVRIA